LLLTAVLLWIWIERRPRLLQTRRAAIDRYRLPAGPTAANPPHVAAAGRWDRQTDGQTDTVPLHRPCRILLVICLLCETHWIVPGVGQRRAIKAMSKLTGSFSCGADHPSRDSVVTATLSPRRRTTPTIRIRRLVVVGEDL